MTDSKDTFWEEFFRGYPDKEFQKLWRIHSDHVNQTLLKRWRPSHQIEELLKTDLFDEAVSEGLKSLLETHAKRVFYMDTSLKIQQMARERHPDLQMVRADVCQLPFAQSTFDRIVSISTLDHFDTLDGISAGLRECHRVLRPGGQMILTLDNLSNPIVLFRNWLPFRLLHRLRIIPYYTGVTLGPYRLQCLLKEIGFRILEVEAIMHCPRVFAIAIAHWLESLASQRIQRVFLHILKAFECFSGLPTRFLTGHFIAVRMAKSPNWDNHAGPQDDGGE